MSIVLDRRSIRRYTSQPVEEKDLQSILEAGMSAPSAHNQQPWHFIVINDRSTLDEIPTVHPHASMLMGAPVAIVVCGDPSKMKAQEYLAQDCSAAVMCMLLRITELGLGGVWLGIHPNPERESGLRRILSIPNDVVPFAIISLGYPAESKDPSGRFDGGRVHINRW